MKNFFTITTLIFLAGLNAKAFTKEDFKNFYDPTTPISNYLKDPESDPKYNFGIKSTFLPYKDPNFYEATSFSSPLNNSKYNSYNLIIVINKNDPSWGRKQTMRVYQRNSSAHGGLIYYWLISTGIKGFETPSGYYTAKSFSSRHWSGQYDVAMRYAVFFSGGKALHSSYDSESLAALGVTASHGCVHIEDNRAEEIFHRVGHSGYGEIDQIHESSGEIRLNNGQPAKTKGYKTLIIVH